MNTNPKLIVTKTEASTVDSIEINDMVAAASATADPVAKQAVARCDENGGAIIPH